MLPTLEIRLKYILWKEVVIKIQSNKITTSTLGILNTVRIFLIAPLLWCTAIRQKCPFFSKLEPKENIKNFSNTSRYHLQYILLSEDIKLRSVIFLGQHLGIITYGNNKTESYDPMQYYELEPFLNTIKIK